MKLLIIAGPYEADRIRKSAVAAGFEAVAVEPGESLSGWITASRPQLIVMAPQMVNPDPALAIAKVRSVPRGRVPIFLVGDEADEPRMASLSEGFFVRPVSPEALLAHAKAVLAAERARESTNLGHELPKGFFPAPAKPAPEPAGAAKPAPGATGRPAISLKPLIAAAASGTVSPARPLADSSALLAELDAGIDALLDAELDQAVATAPRAAALPEVEFFGERTADMKVDHVSGAPAADEAPAPANGHAKATSSPSPAPAWVPPAEAEAPSPLGDDPRERILSRYAVVESGDYYQVLDLPRDATGADIEQAHARVARELEPDAVGSELAGELRAEIEAIREVAGEALRILKDDRLRTRYRAHLSP
jgi:DNA-binding response OmpR family regulator